MNKLLGNLAARLSLDEVLPPAVAYHFFAGGLESQSAPVSPLCPRQALVCRHCQERFPLITQEELKQHEQSHRLCPICMMTCDGMEQPVFEDHVYSHEL